VFSKVVSEGEAVRLLLKEPADVRKALFEHVNRALLCRFLADSLRLLEEQGALLLETALYLPTDVLKLVIRHEGQEVVLGEFCSDVWLVLSCRHPSDRPVSLTSGSVRINARTTLVMLRELISTELDAEAVPKTFAFEVSGAPASSKQEEEWLARELLPAVTLVPRHGDIFQGFEVPTRKGVRRAASRGAKRPGSKDAEGAEADKSGDESEVGGSHGMERDGVSWSVS
jgi:hypothetical protein